MKLNFKRGDKVRFLNSTGSGVVSRIDNNGIVFVSIEDGFDLPCNARDLVLIDSEEFASRMFNKKDEFVQLAQPQTAMPVAHEKKEAAVEKKTVNIPIPEKGLYYALVPHDEDMPVGGNFDAYLLNYSAMELYFRIMLTSSSGRDVTIKTGILQAGDAVLISEVKQNLKNDWLRGKVQFLAVDKKSEKLYPANIAAFHIKEQRLLNDANFRDNVFFDEIALIHPLFEFKNLKEEAFNNEADIAALQESFESANKGTDKRLNTTLIDRHIKEAGFAEVDLHIEKLRSDYKKLRDEEKIRTQLSYFGQCLDSAMAKGVKRVVFIHGVGQGILKDKIRKILDEYENIKYQQASLLKYGDGATEVFFD